MADQQKPASSVRTLPPSAARPQTPPNAAKAAAANFLPNFSAMPFWMGLAISIGWVAVVAMIVAASGSAHTFAGLPLINWAIGITAVASPVGLVWMVAAYMQRAADIQSVAEPLRRQLTLITGESGAAEARIRRFNQAIREQIDLLKSLQNGSQQDFAALIGRVHDQRGELERFEQSSLQQVREIQEIVRRNMQHVEQLMEDKFTMMRILDDKLVQSGDSVARQIEATRDQITEMFENVESNTQQVAEAVARAAQDSKRLSDTARAQETSLLTAAESAAETLGGISSKIDLSIARFLERASSARGEAETLAGTLDAQTRALDEFSNTLPGRVIEAEAVLRGVADRLYASEQLAREQAVNLSEKLALQTDSLQQFLDRLTTRLADVDSGLSARRNDLDAMIARVSDTTTVFTQRWENSITDLGDRTKDYLQRFELVSEGTRKGADDMVAKLANATGSYESAAERMHKLSYESGEQLKNFTAEIGTQLGQFESLRQASHQAGQEVENRANSAMQNLQYVLERLLTAREATQSVGETLVKDLYGAVNQNEQLIGRLNDAAQMSVRALSIAAESLGRQEGELAGQTRAAEAMLQEAMVQTQTRAAAAEKGLREQAAGLMALLAETQSSLNLTEQKLQSVASQAVAPLQQVVGKMDASAEQGLQSLSRYGEGLQEQLSRFQQFHGRVNGMGEELGRITGETLSSIEQLNGRFVTVRTAQEETARQVIDQFTSLADRLQREIAGLTEQTTMAVSTLQAAAGRVGEQSSQLIQDAQNSGAQLQTVTAALQGEALQIRAAMQKQSEELANDLGRAEKQFTTLGEALRQRTDAAYALLDRVAAHYNEVTRAASQDIEARTQRFEQAATSAQVKADAFGASLTQQTGQLTNTAAQLETQTAQIAAISGKAVQQLSAVNEKLALAQESASSGAQQTIARLDEVNVTFMRQNNTLTEASQTAATLIQKAGMSFGEQAGKMLDTSHQTEQHIRNLTASTMALAEQSGQIRSSMEQQNQRLIAQLSEAVGRLEDTSSKLHSVTGMAINGTEEASSRLAAVTQSATARLGTSQQELQDIASRTENTLAALGASISQQASSLTVVHDQVSEQHRTISAANENQRMQLVALFDQMGAAHGQASDVAERTIARLTDALAQIQRQLGLLGDQSQTAVAQVRTASTGFGDQASLLLQNAQAAEQQARTVLSVTAALQEQARQLREALHGETERSNELLTALVGKITSGGADLRAFGSSTEMSLTSLQNAIAQQATALNGGMQQISERQRSLTVALDAQRDVINGLLSRLALAQDETAATAERTVARLTDSTQQVAKQLGIIDAQAQSAIAGVQAATTGFADEAGSLSLHAQQAEQQMRAVLSVTAGMQEQARNLRESMQNETARAIEQLTGVIAQLDGAASQLRQQSGSAIHSMDQTALQFESLTRASGEQLQKQADMLASTANSADQRLADTMRRMGDVSGDTEKQTRQLADAAEYAIERMATLRASAADNDREAREILAEATSRIETVKAALTSELQRLGEASQIAAQQVKGAAESLAVQSDVLRANLATSESALTEAATLLRDETVQLPATLDRSTSEIQAANEVLKTQARDADKTLLGIADRFISVTGAARESMVDEMRQIGQVADKAEETIRGFNKSLAEQVQSMQATAGLLSDSQREMVARAGDSVGHLAAASDRLAQLRNEAMQSAEKLARDFETLESRAAGANLRLIETGENVSKNLDQLAQASQRAENQMLSASTGFREQLERVRSGVQGQIEDINRGLMQITAQLERTGNTLRSTTAGTVADVEKISSRFDQTSKEAATQLTEKTLRMRTSTEEVARLLSGFGDQLDVLLNRLAVAGDGIKRHEGDLTGQMQAALTHLGSVAERLESSRALAGNVSEQAVARLAEVSTALDRQITGLSEKSQTVATVLRNVGHVCGEQTQSLGRNVGDAQTQVVAMNKSIEDMQQRTDRLRVSLKLQGEELMSSLSQILSQLSETGDALSSTVDQVLRDKAAESLKKIG